MADENNYLSRESKMSLTRPATVGSRVFLGMDAVLPNLGHQKVGGLFLG
jgi:hypothetical protein